MLCYVMLYHVNVHYAILRHSAHVFRNKSFNHILFLLLPGIRNQSDKNFVPGTQAPVKPNFCLTRIQTGFTNKDGRMYVINGAKTYIFDPQLIPEKGPILTSKLFGGLDSIDAIFRRQWDGRVVALSGKK